MDATVTTLLALSREPGVAAADLGSCVTDAVARWSSAFEAVGRDLDAHVATSPLASVRPGATATILDVLLDNALHHGAGTVEVAVAPQADGVRIAVTDEGRCDVGAEAAFTRRHSGAGGTGIGLDLARRLAEADGARLRLAADAPTRFELVSPVADPSAPSVLGP